MKKLITAVLALSLLLTGCGTVFDDIIGGFTSGDSVSVEAPASSTADDAQEEESSSQSTSQESMSEESTSEEVNSEESVDEESSFEEVNSEESIDEESTSEEEPEESASEEDSLESSDEGTEHNYVAVVTKPTCKTAGYTTYTCSECGDSYVADEVPALKHIYEGVVTEPTCEDEGYTTYTCTLCGYKCDADEVDPLGHNWLAATTEAPKTCKTCGKTEGEKLPPATTTLDTLYVHYIDVGQGDSILIKVDDCDILIDGGTSNYGSTVSNYLKKQGVDDIELMIATHPDTDHFAGLTQVLNDFVVEEVWWSPYKKSNNSITTFKNAVSSEGLTLKNPALGTVFSYEAMSLTVIFDGKGGSDSNNSSIVVMLEYASYRFLFTGDIGESTEGKLLSSKVDLSCDVLKVGHHGSNTSSTANFLKATGAKYGVICVGAGNSYGHPTSGALNRLSSAGISVYRTDKNGSVVFSTDGEKLYLPGDGGVVTKTATARNRVAVQVEAVLYEERKLFSIPTRNYLKSLEKRGYRYVY